VIGDVVNGPERDNLSKEERKEKIEEEIEKDVASESLPADHGKEHAPVAEAADNTIIKGEKAVADDVQPVEKTIPTKVGQPDELPVAGQEPQDGSNLSKAEEHPEVPVALATQGNESTSPVLLKEVEQTAHLAELPEPEPEPEPVKEAAEATFLHSDDEPSTSSVLSEPKTEAVGKASSIKSSHSKHASSSSSKHYS
jgi:hypothetical protein